ncbi:MAG: DMT family transporter [Tepidisphaeraceae bacterium]
MIGKYLILLIGTIACATAVIFIRMSYAPAAVLCAGRLLMAVVLLSPALVAHWKRRPDGVTARDVLRRTFPGAALLAVHFVTWTIGARMTSAANSSLVVNLVPIAMPFMLLAIVGERVRRHEVIGTIIAMVGVLILSVPKVRTDSGDLRGDAVCFGSMLLVAAYLAIGKLLRRDIPLWLYLVPLYAQAGLMCLAYAVLTGGVSSLMMPMKEYGWLLALAAVPTIVGHSSLNYCMTHLRGQVVSVASLLQFAFAGVMAYFVWGEKPPVQLYPASVLVIVGSLVCIGLFSLRKKPDDDDAARELIDPRTPIASEAS